MGEKGTDREHEIKSQVLEDHNPFVIRIWVNKFDLPVNDALTPIIIIHCIDILKHKYGNTELLKHLVWRSILKPP